MEMLSQEQYEKEMKIFRTRLYKTQLLKILAHISKDNVSASEKFYTDLDNHFTLMMRM